ncbi:MAG: SDR family oxidoreductase [Anaerolineae bacterium]
MKLQDRVAIITGAARGIGLACARRFAAEGAKVVLADVNMAAGQAAADGIRAAGGDAAFVACDVSQKAQVETLVAAAVSAFGRVDIVVNNAGLNHKAEFLETTEEDWDRVIAVDLKGTFLLSQAAARQMIWQGGGGAIVNLSSVMAVLALADQVPYCAAKGGVNQLTKSMALALADKGIRVNAIGPGPVMTELMAVVVDSDAKRDVLLERMPLGRFAECDEIARVAVFLASDDASFITGQTIYPDGGRMIQAFPRKMEA